MHTIMSVGLGIAFSLLFMWPIVTFWYHILFAPQYDNRVKEYQLLAQQLALTEYMMVETINAMRTEHLKMRPIPHQPVLDQFIGPTGWAALISRCRNNIQNAIRQTFFGDKQ